jgi:hypothetical protein
VLYARWPDSARRSKREERSFGPREFARGPDPMRDLFEASCNWTEDQELVISG